MIFDKFYRSQAQVERIPGDGDGACYLARDRGGAWGDDYGGEPAGEWVGVYVLSAGGVKVVGRARPGQRQTQRQRQRRRFWLRQNDGLGD